MSVYPHPTKGPGHWYIDIGYGDKRVRVKHEGTRETALELEAKWRRERAGKKPIATDPRLREIAFDYLATYKLDHLPGKAYQTQADNVRIVVNLLGAHNISGLTDGIIEEYKRVRLQTVKAATINKELSALSGICKWALDKGLISDLPRIKRFPPRLTSAPEPVIPSRSQIEEILKYVPKATLGMYRLMFFYGLRSAEARHIRSEHYSADRRLLRIVGKGNKTRFVPIVDDITHADLVTRQAKAVEGWLWYSERSKGPYKSIRDGLKRAAKKAGISDRMYCHLLRHGCATELVGTADLKTVQALLGHSSIQVTEKYLHIRQDRLTEALTGYVNK